MFYYNHWTPTQQITNNGKWRKVQVVFWPRYGHVHFRTISKSIYKCFTLIIANISHLFQLGKEKRWHEKLATAAAAVKGLLKFKIRPMEMCPSGCCRGKSGLLAYSVSSIYISTVSGIWSIYSLGYLHNIWWTADTGSGQGDLVHALPDNLHPSWLLVSNGLYI